MMCVSHVLTNILHLDAQNTNWSIVYERAYRIPMDTRTKVFQYKFLQDVLVNRYWLNIKSLYLRVVNAKYVMRA